MIKELVYDSLMTIVNIINIISAYFFGTTNAVSSDNTKTSFIISCKLHFQINQYESELLRIDIRLILNIEFLLFSSQIQFLNVVDCSVVVGFWDSILSSFVISNFNPSIVLVIVSIFSDISVCLSAIQIHLKKPESNEDFTIGSSWLKSFYLTNSRIQN